MVRTLAWPPAGGRVLFPALVAIAALTGCASPGKPKPPTLNLPQPAQDLTAARIGDQIELRFKPPLRNTDKLPVTGQLRLQLCREVRLIALESDDAVSERPAACTPLPEQPSPAPLAGQTEALVKDTLPQDLRDGPARLLVYRIALRNSLSRDAGWSAPAYTVAGAVPPQVTALTAVPRPGGVLLTWQAADASTYDPVELHRTLTSAPPPRPANASESPLGSPAGEPATRTLHVEPKKPSTVDPGGTLDTSAIAGSDYRYTASRLRTVTLAGETLTVHSAPSSPIAIAFRDEFPPAAPTGLATAPEGGKTPAINLSWEPNAEPDLAGYRVYRAAAAETDSPAAFTCIAGCGATPVPAPFYRDETVRVGPGYRYRVTAIDHTGHESAPSPVVADQIPAP